MGSSARAGAQNQALRPGQGPLRGPCEHSPGSGSGAKDSPGDTLAVPPGDTGTGTPGDTSAVIPGDTGTVTPGDTLAVTPGDTWTMTPGNAWTVMVGPGAARGQEPLWVSGVAGEGVPSGLPPSLLEDNPWWQAPRVDGHPEVFLPLEIPLEAHGAARLVATTGQARQRLPVGAARRNGQLGLSCLAF